MDRISNVDFADAIGLTRRATTYMAKEDGAPFDRRGWIWPECVRWFLKREAAKARRSEPSGAEDAERRQAIAEAMMAELKLAKQLGETMTVEQYETELRAAFFRVDAKIKNLPQRLSGIAVGLRSPAEALKRFEPLIEEVRAELHGADDIPTDDDERPGAAA